VETGESMGAAGSANNGNAGGTGGAGVGVSWILVGFRIFRLPHWP
jgi:hypothetical protein